MQRLIDAHTHTQPSPAATQEFLDALPVGPPRPLQGTVDELIAGMDANGLDWTLIVPWFAGMDIVNAAVEAGRDRDEAGAEVVARWRDLNAWAAKSAHDNPTRIVAVVGLDPVLMSPDLIASEVRTRLAEGASGLKVAPTYIGLRPDDERMEIVWKLAQEHGVPILSESGSTDYGHTLLARPEYFEEVLRSYPDVVVQLAHLGQGGEAEIARLNAAYGNVYTDTAMRLGGPAMGDLGPAELVDLIRLVGADRVMFGTNYPIVDQVEYAALLRALPLTEDELRLVGHDNAERVWGAR
ncbi:amidohydrolase family protein [Blastococcus sp. CT_GayMR16]|uniref:amidohydrolase family protein n=1 Tax=Blastococcus sp. CT_GayMR16 TaxID=2559607 RepID=UPI00107379FF|nr:amidohydrolase family protein [Blastococcus sp. CT_GayMR16]TFV88806.1 hypothetical protein E4P38_09275 [Blastococcus sp. CT_GayMR16]